MARSSAPSVVEVDGHLLKVTNLEKVLYPATGTTKGEVIAYYLGVASWMLPHVACRPATRKRWPHGVGAGLEPDGAFFQKGIDERSTPDWVSTAVLEHDDGPKTYPLINDAATLVWLAQLASLEIHVPQWAFNEAGERQNPDRLVLDLDPGPGVTMDQCVELAHLIREVFEGAGMDCQPVTSGSKGIHLYAPLDGTLSSNAASELAHELARSLEAMRPDLVVSDMKKVVREGKILLDWSQNNSSKTTIAPYSLRGRKHPTVAAPRVWDEMTTGLQHLEFTDVLERLAQHGDPLIGLFPYADRLATYRSMRTPELTPEPVPEDRPTPGAGEGPVRASSTPLISGAAVAPMLATAGTPDDVAAGEWHFEIKWDGYRAIAALQDGVLALTSRNGLDLSARFPELGALTDMLGARDAILDGEVAVLDEHGRSSFELLQKHGKGNDAHYMIFDLLRLDGESLLGQPYLERRARLKQLFPKDHPQIHVPPTLGTDRDAAIETARDLGLEGVVAKAANGRYDMGRRSSTWRKLKNFRTQDVVVIGWSPGNNARSSTLGSVLLAVHVDGELRYAGKAGSGFSDEALGQARAVLEATETELPPVNDVPRADARGARWVEPLLVAEVSFAEWTASGRLRQPVWRGWRPDLRPEDVLRDR